MNGGVEVVEVGVDGVCECVHVRGLMLVYGDRVRVLVGHEVCGDRVDLFDWDVLDCHVVDCFAGAAGECGVFGGEFGCECAEVVVGL